MRAHVRRGRALVRPIFRSRCVLSSSRVRRIPPRYRHRSNAARCHSSAVQPRGQVKTLKAELDALGADRRSPAAVADAVRRQPRANAAGGQLEDLQPDTSSSAISRCRRTDPASEQRRCRSRGRGRFRRSSIRTPATILSVGSSEGWRRGGIITVQRGRPAAVEVGRCARNSARSHDAPHILPWADRPPVCRTSWW